MISKKIETSSSGWLMYINSHMLLIKQLTQTTFIYMHNIHLLLNLTWNITFMYWIEYDKTRARGRIHTWFNYLVILHVHETGNKTFQFPHILDHTNICLNCRLKRRFWDQIENDSPNLMLQAYYSDREWEDWHEWKSRRNELYLVILVESEKDY